jgi:hypothetical protein
MSEVDDYGDESPRSMRAQLRAQARENGRLRQQLAGRGNAEPAAPEAADSPADDQPDPAARLAEARAAEAAAEAELAAEHAAYWTAAGLPHMTGPPPAIPPETVRAAALVRAAQEGAIAPSTGLDGILTRLQDRTVPYPALLEEMKSMGFRDAPGGWE